MAAPTNTITSATPNVGVREDLENVIYRVAPEETPLVTAIGSAGKATNTYHEWQTETLAAPNSSNYQLEGDDVATLDAPNLTTRLGNYVQILRKSGGVARTQEIVNKAGRASEMARQKTLHGIELRRDFEICIIGNNPAAPQGGSGRRTAGMLAFLQTNVSRGTGGSNGTLSGGTTGYVNAAFTPGTLRTFTEALVKSVMATAFGNGAKPKIAMMGPTQKQEWSGFTGIADMRQEVKGKDQGIITAAADVYVSDFGALALVPHPYGLTRDVLLLDPEYAGVVTLDGVKSKPLASNGDNEKFLMTMEKGLVVKNEKAHASINDVQ